jgi:hypothetical protein
MSRERESAETLCNGWHMFGKVVSMLQLAAVTAVGRLTSAWLACCQAGNLQWM